MIVGVSRVHYATLVQRLGEEQKTTPPLDQRH